MLRIIFISIHLFILLWAELSIAGNDATYSWTNSNSHKFDLYKYHFKPKTDCELELAYTYYQLCYSPKHRIAKWTIHEVNLPQIKGSQKRTNNFRADYTVADPVQTEDYLRSGFDRGHLVPAADMRLNYTSMSDTFYMTNMTPQNPGFNSGVWNSLEAHIRKEVERLGPAIVITAPVLLESEVYPMIRSQVTIPSLFYKIAYFYEHQSMQGYLIPNAHAQGQSFRSFKTTVRNIENVTGIDFFHELHDEIENSLETSM